ncbi:MAG: GrpB family protein [Betaproteobacteria bacterium]|nr:GrpB family protein [Betaproteobacteria bacterium]
MTEAATKRRSWSWPTTRRGPRSSCRERARLEDLLAAWLAGPIEHRQHRHPGMIAKPVIDLMAPVDDLDASRPAIAVVEAAGYAYFPYRAESMHWFCKPSAAFRTHHLHLVPRDSRLWRERLAFRERLRRAAAGCGVPTLKVRLARQHPRDREAYTDAKAPFVRRVVAEALPPGAGRPGRKRRSRPAPLRRTRRLRTVRRSPGRDAAVKMAPTEPEVDRDPDPHGARRMAGRCRRRQVHDGPRVPATRCRGRRA